MYKKKTRLYECNICKKDYSSYQSLWIHNKKFHNETISQLSTNNNNIITNNNNTNQSSSNYNCSYCNNTYVHYQSRWKHEQKCINRTNIIKENEKLKKE